MKASLDTNVILHLYQSATEHIIFDRFTEGTYVHDFIRQVELKRHGHNILSKFDEDVHAGKIQIIDDAYLKKIGMYPSFIQFLREERILYNPQDLGEVYAISLARTLGLSALVTDDIKPCGPHYTLMRMIDNEILPFSFYEILFLDFFEGKASAAKTVEYFERINRAGGFNWEIRSKLGHFHRRFWSDPFTPREFDWMVEFCKNRNVNAKQKFNELNQYIKDSIT